MTTAKAQAEVLMNDLVDFAEKMLKSHGEFHPFGGYLSEEKEIVHVGLSADVQWSSDQHRANALAESLRSLTQKNQPIVLGIVTNVSLAGDADNGDAIRVFLEHKSGYCANVFFHYALRAGHDISILDSTAQQGVPQFFLDKEGEGN